MTAQRFAAMFLCVCYLASLFITARAEGISEASAPAKYAQLEQYAAELSQCTGFKYYNDEYTQRYMDYRVLHPDYTLDAIISYVNIGLDRSFYSCSAIVANPASTRVLVNKYHQLPSDYIPARLELISSLYSSGTQRLTHTARIAFENMCADAKKYGYGIYAASAYRSYTRQASVYASFFIPGDPNSVVSQDLLAARPGFSEHQTGLAVDVRRADLNQSAAAVYNWYAKNSYKYGFILRYPSGKENVTGYAAEPWHLRYIGTTLARAVYLSTWTFDEYYVREVDVPVNNTQVVSIGITSTATVTAGNQQHQLSVLRIFGQTYFKLRDIAVLLSGTSAQFDIKWDSTTGAVNLIKGSPYSSTPSLSTLEASLAVNTVAVTPTLVSGGQSCSPAGYSYLGSNYLTLNETAALLGIPLTADSAGTFTFGT